MSRKAEITKDVLCILGAIGLLAIAIAAPNVVRVLAKHKSFRKYNKRKLSNSISYLKYGELISIGQEGDKTVIKLTKNGRERLLKYKLEDLRIPKPSKWDRKWWLVIFDIPEEHKSNRTAFVKKLKEIGFVMVQKSAWVYPYACENEIDFLKEIYEVRSYVRILKSDYLDIQNDLLQKFGL